MKATVQCLSIALVSLAGMFSASAQPAITSFSQNGVLVCSNLALGSVATVAWSSSPSGPWQTNWDSLTAITPDTNGAIQVSVPMYYRVLGVSEVPSGMALVPAGSFTMGDTLDGDGDALATNIYVSAFYMDINLVSYGQWQMIYGDAISRGYSFVYAGAGRAANQPVVMVDWYDCVKWCNARSELAELTPVYYTDAALTQVYTSGETVPYVNWAANGYRLPTEAEWEKAARGGLSNQRFPWGLTISESQANYSAGPSGYAYDLGPYSGANTNFNTGGTPYTSPLGYFVANGYGLYDMAGNAAEWCWDWYGTPYGQPAGINPTGSPSGSMRVYRGGSWQYGAKSARCANRSSYSPVSAASMLGFRCVRPR